MKILKDEVSLSGKAEEITLMDLRQQPGEVFASVALGKVFVVTKKGEPIAVISKPPGETLLTIIDEVGKVSYGTSMGTRQGDERWFYRKLKNRVRRSDE